MRDALARLEDELASPSASKEWRVDVGAALAGLRAAFAAHIEAVESDEGLLADIAEDVPRLTNVVELLERDHVEISQKIDDLVDSLGTVEIASIREQSLDLMRAVVLHRQRGSDLVYEAYATDIGGQSGG